MSLGSKLSFRESFSCELVMLVSIFIPLLLFSSLIECSQREIVLMNVNSFYQFLWELSSFFVISDINIFIL